MKGNSGQPLISLVDGQPGNALPVDDRGLLYGDGLFETILVWAGKPVLLPLHLDRLTHGCTRLHIPINTTAVADQLAQALALLEQGELPQALSARVTVTRGSGERGYSPQTAKLPRVVVSLWSYPADPRELMAPLRLGIARQHLAIQPALAGLKHLNRLEQVIAAAERTILNVDDVLLQDTKDRVISSGSGNLFVLADGELLTPRLDKAGIEGTVKRLVIEHLAPDLGFNIRELDLELDTVLQADEVFVSNSLQGLRPVSAVGTAQFSDYSTCGALFDRYRDYLN